jgi:hypothetical protein
LVDRKAGWIYIQIRGSVACDPAIFRAAVRRPRFGFAKGRRKMTKLTRDRAITFVRGMLLAAPVLALAACQPPPPPAVAGCDACAAAARAQATADQALSLAQQAMAASQQTVSRESYERSLRK